MIVRPIRDGEISSTNVRPAVEATRALGLDNALIERGLASLGLHALGPDAVIDGQVTYAHFEWLSEQLDEVELARFMVGYAARRPKS